MPDPQTFTVDRLATRWGVHPRTIRNMLARGELRGFRCGRLVRISAAEVERCETSGLSIAAANGPPCSTTPGEPESGSVSDSPPRPITLTLPSGRQTTFYA